MQVPDRGAVLADPRREPRVGGVALEEVETVPFRSRLRLRVARRQPQLDVREALGHDRAPFFDRRAPDFRRARGGERGPGRLDRALGLDARDLGSHRTLLRFVQRGTRRARIAFATDAPGTRAADAVPCRGDRDEAGVREHEIKCRAPTVDEHGVREQRREDRVQTGHLRVDLLDQRARTRRYERRLRRRRSGGVGDEQECVRVAVLELLDRAPQRITPLDHDGTHRVPERRRDRDLGAGRDLQVVDERPDHTGDAFELERARGGTRRAQLRLEHVGARPPACGLRLRRAPAVVRRAQRLLGRDDRGYRVGAGQREIGGLRVELGDPGPQLDRVRDQGLDDAFVGGGGQLALHTPALLVDQCREAAAALTQRLGAHEPFTEVVVAQRGERVLGLDDGVVEGSQQAAQLGLSGVELGAFVAETVDTRLEAGDLVSREVQLDGAQLGHDRAVPLGGLRLALQRRELATHLPQQVVEAEQVALGRGEPPLGALLAFPVLQDARGLLDDRAAVAG